MSKSEKRVPATQYVNNDWYNAQLDNDWYISDYDSNTNELIMRKMSENGYGSITPQQASLMKYSHVRELTKNQVRIILGNDYREEDWADWETRRKTL